MNNLAKLRGSVGLNGAKFFKIISHPQNGDISVFFSHHLLLESYSSLTNSLIKPLKMPWKQSLIQLAVVWNTDGRSTVRAVGGARLRGHGRAAVERQDDAASRRRPLLRRRVAGGSALAAAPRLGHVVQRVARGHANRTGCAVPAAWPSLQRLFP